MRVEEIRGAGGPRPRTRGWRRRCGPAGRARSPGDRGRARTRAAPPPARRRGPRRRRRGRGEEPARAPVRAIVPGCRNQARGLDHLDARETPEVRVGRMKLGLMLDGQARRDAASVVRLPAVPRALRRPKRTLRVAIAGVKHADLWLFQPRSGGGASGLHRKRVASGRVGGVEIRTSERPRIRPASRAYARPDSATEVQDAKAPPRRTRLSVIARPAWSCRWTRRRRSRRAARARIGRSAPARSSTRRLSRRTAVPETGTSSAGGRGTRCARRASDRGRRRRAWTCKRRPPERRPVRQRSGSRPMCRSQTRAPRSRSSGHPFRHHGHVGFVP